MGVSNKLNFVLLLFYYRYCCCFCGHYHCHNNNNFLSLCIIEMLEDKDETKPVLNRPKNLHCVPRHIHCALQPMFCNYHHDHHDCYIFHHDCFLCHHQHLIIFVIIATIFPSFIFVVVIVASVIGDFTLFFTSMSKRFLLSCSSLFSKYQSIKKMKTEITIYIFIFINWQYLNKLNNNFFIPVSVEKNIKALVQATKNGIKKSIIDISYFNMIWCVVSVH